MDERRTNNFDFARLALAVAVIYSHAYVLTGGVQNGELVHWLTGGIFEAGMLAVNGFFVISGFLITASWERSSSIVSYLKKRIYRIYPGFIVAWALGVFVVAPLVSDAVVYPGTLKMLAGLVLLNRNEPEGAFLDNVYPGVINGSLWTISYEFRCYLMVIALGLTGVVARRSLLVTLTVLVLGMHVAARYVPLPTMSGPVATVFGQPDQTLRLLTYFLLGATFYRWGRDFSARWAAVAVIASCLSLLHPATARLVLPVGFAYGMLWFCLTPSIKLHGWGRYGDFSYGTYLYAFPIQQLLVWWSGNSMHPLVHCAIAIPLSVAAGVMSWHLVEKHCLARAHRRVPPAVPLATATTDATTSQVMEAKGSTAALKVTPAVK